jgi:hypothetical protein
MGFNDQEIKRVYAGWSYNKLKNYLNCWGYFIDFLLEGIAEQVCDLESEDELDLLKREILTWLMMWMRI